MIVVAVEARIKLGTIGWVGMNNLLKNEIPLIENLVNLEKIQKERVFYIGLPPRVAHLDSSWIRAIALEPL